jgi:nucleoside-diphosphate-sugar epimerase
VRVAVIGATGVMGTAAVRTLTSAGHDVVGLARNADKARLLEGLGARAHLTSLGDHDGLVAMLDGADAVCNLASSVPVGLGSLRPGAWRANDGLRTEGVARVLAAAREARVRRVVQAGVSFLYADQGDAWIGEDAPLDITGATEPASVAESRVQDYCCGSRTGVLLRFATILGDDPTSTFMLRSARNGVAVGLGTPHGWAHVIHTDDLGPAVLGALSVPSGVYNVGAEPVRRDDLVRGLSAAAGRDSAFIGSLGRRLGGARMEPLARSLRVSSDLFTTHSGWAPTRARFDASWFAGPLHSEALR